MDMLDDWWTSQGTFRRNSPQANTQRNTPPDNTASTFNLLTKRALLPSTTLLGRWNQTMTASTSHTPTC
ncbi:hypothetical protein CMUS01_00322 [Colletotrichum musicola]|uniref:Uncharacterized protein n=1 Tax=Colletotrichum musicola TaxID=2175873 RepID=A0A8H6NYZ6_9PEZI|nr:hypothetical protein CMUS01_00322 [Colletotrichum musicola]